MKRPAVRTSIAIAKSRFLGVLTRSRICLFHDFVPPPIGGGHQFLRALVAEFRREGHRVAINRLGKRSEVVLINSFNFRPRLLRAVRRFPIRCVHRLDGPMQSYRGFDDGTDDQVVAINREFADLSVFQSAFSKREHERLGLQVRPGPVISNAADPEVFSPRPRRVPSPDAPLRVLASSWSDNPNKGADVLEWLDRNLDPALAEVTFLGRTPVALKRIRHLPAAPSEEVAAQLREHDVFLAASRNDPCSNSVIEALTVGLPVLYRDSGGHPELVGEGGAAFSKPTEIPLLLKAMRYRWTDFSERIRTPSLREVARAYLAVLLPDDPNNPE